MGAAQSSGLTKPPLGRSYFFICLRANAETALFLLRVEDSHHSSNDILLNQRDQFIVQ